MSEIEFCRICANLTNSSEAEKLFERSQKNLLRKIQDLIGHRLQNMKDLPQLICEKCQDQMLQVHLFRKCCLRAQKHFTTAAYKTQVKAVKRQSSASKKENLNSHVGLDSGVPSIEEVVLDNINIVKVEPEALHEYGEAIMQNQCVEVLLNHQPPPTINAEECSYSDGGTDWPTLDYDDDDTSEVQAEQLRCSLAVDAMHALSGEAYDVSAGSKPTQGLSESSSPHDTKINNSNHEKNSKHQKTNGRKADYICDQCGAYFTSFTVFSTHLRRHAGEKPYQCEVCPEKFFSSALLLRHIRKHTGEKPYPCRHCERRFLDMSTRLRHERMHNNHRPFVCQQCGKAFTVGHTLVNHMLTHTNERAFSCKICKVAFKRKPHLVTHYRSVTHKENEEKYHNSLAGI